MPARPCLDDDVDPALAGLLRLRGADAVSSLEAGTVDRARAGQPMPEVSEVDQVLPIGRAIEDLPLPAGGAGSSVRPPGRWPVGGAARPA